MEKFDALAHPAHPEPACAGAGVKPAAVIADAQHDRRPGLGKFEHRTFGMTVLGGVCHRLLDDPIDRGLQLGGLDALAALPQEESGGVEHPTPVEPPTTLDQLRVPLANVPDRNSRCVAQLIKTMSSRVVHRGAQPREVIREATRARDGRWRPRVLPHPSLRHARRPAHSDLQRLPPVRTDGHKLQRHHHGEQRSRIPPPGCATILTLHSAQRILTRAVVRDWHCTVQEAHTETFGQARHDQASPAQ